MEYLFIYLLQLSDSLDGILCLCVFISIALAITIIVLCVDNYINGNDTSLKPFKNYCIAFVLISILISLIPNRQTLLLMGATYMGKKAINAVITDSKIQKVNTIINLELDNKIKELQMRNNNANSTEKR